MGTTMELTERNLEQVGSYVREHLGTWIQDVSLPTATVQLDPIYLERIVRVEEELKSQRELMKQGFEQMDKRFEQVDKRFDETRADMNARFALVDKRLDETRADMNARFEAMDKRFAETRAEVKAGFDGARHHTNIWMMILTLVIAIVAIGGPILAALVV